MGRWRLDSAATRLTIGIDYFMGKRMVHPRYRRGQDFFLDYDILLLTPGHLQLRDPLTDERRTFEATAVEHYEEASQRRIPKPDFGPLRLPGQGNR